MLSISIQYLMLTIPHLTAQVFLGILSMNNSTISTHSCKSCYVPAILKHGMHEFFCQKVPTSNFVVILKKYHKGGGYLQK